MPSKTLSGNIQGALGRAGDGVAGGTIPKRRRHNAIHARRYSFQQFIHHQCIEPQGHMRAVVFDDTGWHEQRPALINGFLELVR